MSLKLHTLLLLASVFTGWFYVPSTAAYVLTNSKRTAGPKGMNENQNINASPAIGGEVLRDAPWAPSGNPHIILSGRAWLKTLNALQKVVDMSKSPALVGNFQPNRHVQESPPLEDLIGSSDELPMEANIMGFDEDGQQQQGSSNKIQPAGNEAEAWTEFDSNDDLTADEDGNERRGTSSWWDHLARMATYIAGRGEGGAGKVIGWGETVARKKQLPKNGSRFIPRLGRRR